MRSSIVCLLLIGLLLALDVDESSAWWWGRTTSSRCHGGRPYYFGTTDLNCMTGKKYGKRAPSRRTWRYIHSWIYYEGHYFERLSKQDVYNATRPTSSDKCSSHRERSPAGYSRLSVDCIKRCTRRYRGQFGGYSTLWNNCHDFSNKISEVLCDYTTCPSWCQ